MDYKFIMSALEEALRDKETRIGWLRDDNVKLTEQNTKLTDENIALKQEIEQLKGDLDFYMPKEKKGE